MPGDVPQPTDIIPPQDICIDFREQGPCGVLWDPSVGEIGRDACVVISPTCDIDGPPTNPGRCFQHVRSRCTPPVQGGSQFACDYVRCAGVPASDAGFRGLLITGIQNYLHSSSWLGARTVISPPSSFQRSFARSLQKPRYISSPWSPCRYISSYLWFSWRYGLSVNSPPTPRSLTQTLQGIAQQLSS